MELTDAVAELYGAAPGDFVPTRTALARRARAAGDTELAKTVAGLRKPSVAAWAVNRLVRDRPDLARTLADLGERMRRAQAHLEAAELARLRPERDDLLAELHDAAGAAAAEAGAPLSAAAGEEVRGTFVASLADEAAQDAVTSGHLTRALSYAGFGEVDLADALVAVPGGAGTTDDEGDDEDEESPDERPLHAVGPDEGDADAEAGTADDAEARARERERAYRRRVEEARQALRDADRTLADASLAAAEARRRAEKAEARVAELTRLLDRARDESAGAGAAADEADAAAARAQEEVEGARARLADVEKRT